MSWETRAPLTKSGKTKKSLFLFPRTFFLDLVWIAPVPVLCTSQVIAKLWSPTSYVFSSEWRGSCDVIRIKYIHGIFLTRQAVLAARLVLSEYWVLTVTAAFGQRKRKLQKIEKRENSHKKENSNMITAQTTTRLSFSKVRRARVKNSIAKILKGQPLFFKRTKKG